MTDSFHIVCPQCSSVNRIVAQRLSDKPKCGHCKQALFLHHPIELTTNTFARHISRNDIPVVVDFWAPWCGPCKMMAPAYSKAAAELEPKVRVAKVNTEKEQTLALFKNGVEIARQAGAMGTEDIIRWVRSLL